MKIYILFILPPISQPSNILTNDLSQEHKSFHIIRIFRNFRLAKPPEISHTKPLKTLISYKHHENHQTLQHETPTHPCNQNSYKSNNPYFTNPKTPKKTNPSILHTIQTISPSTRKTTNFSRLFYPKNPPSPDKCVD